MARSVESIGLALALLVTSSCGGGARSRVRAPQAATPARELDAFVEVVPVGGNDVIEGHEPDGARTLAIGGSRFLRGDGDQATLAPDDLVHPIIAAVRAPSGWTFVDRSGVSWRAARWLDTPEMMGRVELPEIRGVTGTDVLGVVSGPSPGTLYSSDGVLPFRRVTALPERSVESAAFADARTGIAVLDGGQIAFTADAGASWRALQAPELGRDVLLVDGAFFVTPRRVVADRSVLHVGRDGTVARGTYPAEREWPAQLAALGRVMSTTLPPAILVSAPALRDGRLVIPARASGPRDVTLVDPRSRRATTLTAAFPGERCGPATWGQWVGVRCGGAADQAGVLYRTNDAARFERICSVPSASADSLLWSLDGRSAAWRGSCDATPTDSPRAWCIVREETGWHPEARSLASESQIPTMSGDWILDVVEGTPVVTRMSSGATRELAIDDRGLLVRAGLTTDGLLWVNQVAVERPVALRMGPPDGRLLDVPLPEGALGAAMLDARRGVAAGADLTRAWRTRDGGRAWEPIGATVRGDPHHVSLLDEIHPRDGDITCDSTSCRIRGSGSAQLVVRGWGALVQSQRAPIVGAPTAQEPPSAASTRDAVTALALECAPEGNLLRAAAPPGRTVRGATSVTAIGGGGAARVSLRPATIDRARRWQIAWRGEDERGTFSGQTRETDAPDGLGEITERPPRLVGVTRAGVYVMLTVEEEQQLYWGPIAGDLVERSGHRFTRDAAIRAIARDAAHSALVLREMDGSEWLFADGPTDTEAPFWFRQAIGERSAAAVRGPGADVTMAVSLPAGEGFRLFPSAGELPVDLPIRTGLAACREPRAADARDVLVASGPFVVPDAARRFGGARARTDIELSGDRACIRAIELWPSDRGASARLVATGDGALAGIVETETERLRARCTLVRFAP